MLSKNCAVMERERCAACGACMNECPRNAITIWRGCFAVVDETMCVGCGKCAKICPADCITVKERENV